MMQDVENMHFETFAEEEKCVEDCRVMYECMYHREDQLDAEYGETSLEDKLDIMESFVRVTPMPIKSGEMVFLCNCGDAYKYYACVHSGVLSMLWNQDMTFPDAVRAHHLKAKQTKKVLNPFEAVAKRKKQDKDKISDSSAPADSQVIWKPVLPTYSPPLEDSGASMGAKGKCMEPALPQAVMQCLSYPAKRCFDGFSCTYRRHPWMALLRLTLMLPRRRVARRQIVCSLTWIPSFLLPPKARVLLSVVNSRRRNSRSC
jgi:hypothetical protein